jgi:glutathione peroxidase
MKLYDLNVLDKKGNEVSLKKYEGKVLLIINSATGCGFTPQYDALEAMYRKYKDKGFEILDFPCNQFGFQAPGSDDEITSFCTARYNMSFTQFMKIEVNGKNESELFKLLKSCKGFKGFGTSKMDELLDGMLRSADPDYDKKSDIKWNFTKFLVDRNGNIVERFEPTYDMILVEEKVKELL